MTRRHDPRRARRHLSYTRAELSALYSVGTTTITAWVGKGLVPIDDRRPFLFAGSIIQKFLESYNKPRHPTRPGEIFCVACKKVIVPAGSVVDFVPLSATNGNIVGVCPLCSRRVYQRVRTDGIERKAGSPAVRYEEDMATFPTPVEPARSEPSEGIGL